MSVGPRKVKPIGLAYNITADAAIHVWAACGNEQCLEGAHVISLIRAISRHNIENSIVQPCGAVQPRSTTRRDFKYLQKEQPDISRLWPFRTAREALT